MAAKFKVGDHVTWNSEAGQVSGKIIKVHTKDADYKGCTHHASPDDRGRRLIQTGAKLLFRWSAPG